MHRREFLNLSALAAGGALLDLNSGVAAAGKEQRPVSEKSKTAAGEVELRPDMSRAAGEQVLRVMARTPNPVVRTAAFGKTKTEGGWFFGESQKQNERPNFSLYANNFEDAFLREAEELWLYRVGPGSIPTNPKSYEAELQERLRRKELLTNAPWVSYLPDLVYQNWAECELLTNAYFAYKTQGVVRNKIVTPYGDIEFYIQPASSLWSGYNAQFEVAQEVLGVVQAYGQPFTEEFRTLTFGPERDPVNRLKAILMSRSSKLFIDAANDVEDAFFAEQQQRFLNEQVHVLTLAQRRFQKSFHEPKREFDIQKTELEVYIREGRYDTLGKLMTAVSLLYTTIDVQLTFIPG